MYDGWDHLSIFRVFFVFGWEGMDTSKSYWSGELLLFSSSLLFRLLDMDMDGDIDLI